MAGYLSKVYLLRY